VRERGFWGERTIPVLLGGDMKNPIRRLQERMVDNATKRVFDAIAQSWTEGYTKPLPHAVYTPKVDPRRWR
jgi:hypothetical protein